MATFTLNDKRFYTGGTEESASQIVGYAQSKNRVVRFTFTTDSIGAGSVSWYIEDNYFANGTIPELRWYIGTSATSHINAGASTTTYSGDVTITNNAGEYIFSGDADVLLLPNTTYYFWLFPSVTTSGYFHLSEIPATELTTSGRPGVVYIDDGKKLNAYQVYIDDGDKWNLYIPYIDNGTSWDVCV